MATVINDLTIEPKPAAAAPAPDPAKAASGAGTAGPELDRELEKAHRRDRERALRLWAH